MDPPIEANPRASSAIYEVSTHITMLWTLLCLKFATQINFTIRDFFSTLLPDCFPHQTSRRFPSDLRKRIAIVVAMACLITASPSSTSTARLSYQNDSSLGHSVPTGGLPWQTPGFLVPSPCHRCASPKATADARKGKPVLKMTQFEPSDSSFGMRTKNSRSFPFCSDMSE